MVRYSHKNKVTVVPITSLDCENSGIDDGYKLDRVEVAVIIHKGVHKQEPLIMLFQLL